MLSAKQSSMPAVRPIEEAGQASGRLYCLALLFGRLTRKGRKRAPKLNASLQAEDLRADIGLGEPIPGRVERFWQEKRRSAARDLPL